jgi:hypothetical protein
MRKKLEEEKRRAAALRPDLQGAMEYRNPVGGFVSYPVITMRNAESPLLLCSCITNRLKCLRHDLTFDLTPLQF